MRRLSSIFISAAVAISGLTLTSTVASAAGGTATIKTAGMVAPSSVPNAQILRVLRLNNSNTFFIVGIDTNTAGANMHLWKIKEDLTLDTSFTPVDLGNDFEYPTASNSSCIANSNQLSAC